MLGTVFLNYLINVLFAYNGYNQDKFFVQLVVYAVNTTNASSVPFLYVIYGFKRIGLLGYYFEIIEEGIIVFICLSSSKTLNSILMDSN